jgi:hypothetical protein
MTSVRDESVLQAQRGQLRLAGAVIWAGAMLLLLAGWLWLDLELDAPKTTALAVCGALLSVLGFVAGLRMADGARLAKWYGMGAVLLLAAAAGLWWNQRSQLYPALALALAALCGVMAGLRLLRPVHMDETGYEPLARAQAVRLGAVLLVVGAAALGLAGYVAYLAGSAGVGAAAGAGLLGLSLLGLGIGALRSPPNAAEAVPTASWGRALGILLCGLGVIGFVAALLMGRTELPTISLMPEAICLGVAAVVLFGVGLVLLTDAAPATLRSLLPLAGVVLGIVLSVGALWWVAAQPDMALRGGLRSWTGEGAWLLWAAAYQVVIGLMCPLVAFQLVSGTQQQSSDFRRPLARLRAAMAVVFAILALIVANVFFFAFLGQTYSWSKGRGLYSISDATKRAVSGLKEPTTVYVFARNPDSVPHINTLLANCRAESKLLTVRPFDSITNQDFQSLRQRFKDLPLQPDGLLLVYGEGKGDAVPKHAYIPHNKILVQESRTRDEEPRLSFRGEQELLRELRFLAFDGKKRPVYFLQGHGELDISKAARTPFRRTARDSLDSLGSGVLVKKLGADRFDVKGLAFTNRPVKDAADNVIYLKENTDKAPQIPDDCEILVVLGPSQAMEKTTLDAIEGYLDRGGRMFVAFDVFADKDYGALRMTGLEDVLAKYGVRAGKEFVLRLSRNYPFRLLGRTGLEMQTSLAQRLAGVEYMHEWTARVLKTKEKGRFQVEPIIEVASDQEQLVVSEIYVPCLQDPLRHIDSLRFDPTIKKRLEADAILTVGVTVAEPREKEKSARPRLVVLGDSEMFMNGLMEATNFSDDHYSFFSNAMDWLSDRQDVGGTLPRDMGIYTIRPTTNINRMVGAPLWLMLLCVLGLGTCLWLVRRR